MNSQNKRIIKNITFSLFSIFVGIFFASMVIDGGSIAYAKLGKPGSNAFAKFKETYKEKDLSFLNPKNYFFKKITYENTQEATVEVNTSIIEEKKILPKTEHEPNTITIGWVGDITPFNASTIQSLDSTQFSFVKDYLTYPDIMIGNLEGVITTNNISKCAPDAKNCFTFKGDNSFVSLLKDSGFDIMNLANNHAYDYGKDGYNDTIKALDGNGILKTGIRDGITITEIAGTKIAVVGFSPHNISPPLTNDSVENTVKKAKELAPIIVMVFHGGGEGMQYMHTKIGEEMYLDENRGDVINMAHTAIDAGANLVVGSGPHILRGMEWYKGSLIAYSLGNFSAYHSLSVSGFLGISGILYTTLAPDGTTINSSIIPIVLDASGKPNIDTTNKAISIINSLSDEDFGMNAVTIQESGDIINKSTQ
jgi:hypothetical protein